MAPEFGAIPSTVGGRTAELPTRWANMAQAESYFEAAAALDPDAVVSGCIESGAQAVLLDAPALPPQFFDLSSGLAGELLHNLTKYRLRLAGVIPDASVCPLRFQEFLRETNRGSQFRFFTTRSQAIAWLESS